MEEELPKAYNPDVTEEKWYYFWERKGVFHVDPLSDKEPYCIVMPPPNVTGVLHMGHALVNALQDVMIRWKRMEGYEALWVPGLDHAGISTQTVVERDLIAKTGKRRSDFERKEFLGHVWKWKEKSEDRIVGQLKRLGCSCDWLRKRFTMDEESNLAVRTLFKKMYEEGLIYQGDYLVNWDPVTETALADDEVEYEERETKLWHFRYPLEEGEGHLTIATTRPETMLGDVAVAVSPKDPRYKKLVGKNVVLPIVNRVIPIVADNYVDPEFGTGVVKITPAHDPNDWELGKRHDLPLINILNSNGTLNENGLEYEGLSMEEARRHVVTRMKELGHLEKIDPYTHRVGVSYRSKAIIEPYLSKQWFIKMEPFKKKLIDAVKKGRVKIIPKNWESTYFHWIENLRDWCISRQLWWGHRIPIWKHESGKIICYEGTGRPPEVVENPEGWSQDPDVLDTWFSSALWPFSTLGWPHTTHELKKFYPNSTLITGHDILFFWVARMIMMGEYVMGEAPFAETSLQGLIFGKSYWRENKEGGITYASLEEKKAFDLGTTPPKEVHSKWEKMSKSKGNVIDPIEIINTYGTDAMRMALAASATHSPQIDLDRRRFEEFKNFANKVWNGSRFVLMNLTLTAEEFQEGLGPLALEDRWILSVLNRTIEEMKTHFEGYHFDRAAMRSYTFFWDEFCAYYVEMAKPTLFAKNEASKHKQKVLLIVLLAAIRLMHPIAPFITEEIFQKLKERFPHIKPSNADPYTAEAIEALLSPACIVSPYPKVINKKDISPEIEETFAFLNEIVYAIRNIRAEMQLPPGAKTDVIIEGKTEAIEPHGSIISSLVRTQSLSFNPEEKPSGFTSSALVKGLKILIPLPEELQEKEKKRLEKEVEKLTGQIASLNKQLSNPNFVERAPAELVNKTKSALSETEEKLAATQEKLKQL
ncbi:valine--tRNA ligase [Candidatus Neptunochlamydia vexilliferae]|uniref:Valine--tRNA ligase n=1 Tax=Candidatus Neptunichlamydia vexilliferae TaxID=1651774 RepID=A0ABS0B1E9_9BACT|nr:valine--tRNA ligase [Candidatus Neptunochlamydia vexilliferae]MBF5060015.1 Valine--tRNA ligase [Candidatus Neptunochlamydia vexilliferae]